MKHATVYGCRQPRRAISAAVCVGLLMSGESALARERSAATSPTRAAALPARDAAPAAPSPSQAPSTSQEKAAVEPTVPPAESASEGSKEGKVAEARQRFDRGVELYEDGDFSLALIEFTRAYELVPNFRVLYNIAQVSIQLDRYADARRALEAYVRRGESRLSEERRAMVMKDLAMLAGRTAQLDITTSVAGAEVLVDDVVVGRSPLSKPLLVDAGIHKVLVRHPSHEPGTSRVTLAGGDEQAIEIELLKRQSNSKTIVVRDSIIKDNSQRNLMIAGWVATGALAAGAVVTGIMGAGEQRELEQLRRADGEQVDNLRESLDSAGSNARSLLLASDVFSGAALLVGGLSLWVTLTPEERPSDEKAPPATTFEVGYEKGQVRLRGAF